MGFDDWLVQLFDAEHLDVTVALLTAVAEDDGSTAQLHKARKTMAEYDHKLAKYRTALESGTDPADRG